MKHSYEAPVGMLSIEIALKLDPSRLSIKLQPGTEQPALGEPGKQAGDLLLAQNAQSERTLLVGLGKREKIKAESFRQAGGSLARWLASSGASEVQVKIDELDTLGVEGAVEALCEGLLLGAFRFDRYKKGDGQKKEVKVFLVGGGETLTAIIERARRISAAVNLARDWAHEPANVINPITLAERVTDLAERYGLKATVIDDQALAGMGAGAIQAVGKGSKTPARLIILEYSGRGSGADAAPVAIVGKAITFDTGGYSMKDPTNMVGMKYDKCGAMAVVGTLMAAAEMGLKQPLVGVIAAAENMASGEAYRPDDIVTTLSGKTVEIISTDAEGRLVLADALAYTQKHFRPRAMVDLATLTGGVVVALGHVRAGIMSNDDALADALLAAGERTNERLWRLPLDEEYEQQIKGDDGDIKNSGGRLAAPVIGGTFLKLFVEPEIPWAHIDIAGTAETDKDLPYCQKGATGFGVRLLINYLEGLN